MKKKNWVTLVCSLFLMTNLFSQTARVQIIHNSPTPTVDIYANGDKLLNNFVFRTATPFIDVPAEVEITLGVAPASSSSAADALANFPVTLADGASYVVIASGVLGGNPGFGLSIFDMAKETTDAEDNVGLLFFHGAPDAPAVDIVAGGQPVFDDVSFGEFSGYLEVPADKYELGVTPANDNSNYLANYNADFSFWKNRTAVVFASGFLGGEDPAFEPWVALSTGGTFPLKAIDLPPAPGARAQILHNASEAPIVDIYINTDLLLDDFEYRNGTPFIDVPTNTVLTVGVAPPNSTSSADAIASFDVQFEDGEKYIIVAEGLLSAAPGFTLNVYDEAQEEAEDDDEVDLLVHHGSPTAPAVDVAARGVGDLVKDISFGEFQGYLSVDPANYYLDVKPAGTNDIVGTYTADVSGLAGAAAMVFASGNLGAEHDFGLYALLQNGVVIELPEAQLARLQVIHNSPRRNVDVYVNGDLLLEKFVFRTATPYIDVPSDVLLDIAIAPSGSNSAADAVANFPVTLDNGATYVAIANGIVGGNPGFNLEVFPMGQETVGDGNVGLLFFHGSPDAPTVDITTGGNVLFDDVSYGDFQGYLEVPAANYEIAVTPGNDNNTIVAEYAANFDFWKRKTAVIFASGFLGGQNPGFEPWVALSTGGTFPLKTLPSSPPLTPSNETLEFTSIAPNPSSNRLSSTFSITAETEAQLILTNAQGIPVLTRNLGTLNSGEHNYELNVSRLSPGFYNLFLKTNRSVATAPVSVFR